MTTKIQPKTIENYVKKESIPDIVQLSKAHTTAHLVWLETKNKIAEQMHVLQQQPSAANYAKLTSLSFHNFLADKAKQAVEIRTHEQLKKLVDRYVYRLNGTLQEPVEAFPLGQEQMQFLQQIAAFGPGFNPSKIDQSPLPLQTPQPSLVSIEKTSLPTIPEDELELNCDAAFRPGSNPAEIDQSPLPIQTPQPSLVSIEKASLPTIPEDELELYCDEVYEEPKPAISSPEKKKRAASALLTLRIAPTSVAEKKQPKRQRLPNLCPQPKTGKIHRNTSAVIASPEKKRAANALLTLQTDTPAITEKKQPKRRRLSDLCKQPKKDNAHRNTSAVIASSKQKRAANASLTFQK